MCTEKARQGTGKVEGEGAINMHSSSFHFSLVEHILKIPLWSPIPYSTRLNLLAHVFYGQSNISSGFTISVFQEHGWELYISMMCYRPLTVLM